MARIGKIGAVFCILAAAAASAPQKRSPEAPPMPEGKARQVMEEACVQCHDFRVIAAQRKIPAAWRRTVNEMVWKGAPLVNDEADLVARYLAAAFGASPPEKK